MIHLKLFDPIWSNLIQFYLIWSNLIQSDPVWSSPWKSSTQVNYRTALASIVVKKLWMKVLILFHSYLLWIVNLIFCRFFAKGAINVIEISHYGSSNEYQLQLFKFFSFFYQLKRGFVSRDWDILQCFANIYQRWTETATLAKNRCLFGANTSQKRSIFGENKFFFSQYVCNIFKWQHSNWKNCMKETNWNLILSLKLEFLLHG